MTQLEIHQVALVTMKGWKLDDKSNKWYKDGKNHLEKTIMGDEVESWLWWLEDAYREAVND